MKKIDEKKLFNVIGYLTKKQSKYNIVLKNVLKSFYVYLKINFKIYLIKNSFKF
jgi:hypothetical protein